MNKLFKSNNLFALAILLLTFGCSSDDEGSVANNSINIENLTVTLDENPTDGQAIGTVETDGSGTLSFSITSQTPAGALSIASSTGALTVANAALFDFETNPIITATITAVGASSPATVTINLNNLNEASLQDLTLAVDENPTDGQVLGTVQGNGTSNFSISSQTPAGSLAIDATSGEVTVADATLFDFETNPVITASISVDDAENLATVTINLTNINELSAQDLTVAVDENPTDGQVVGTIQVTGGGTLNFSIASQTPAAALDIDASTGELTVADPNIFDFETNPVITATIQIEDTADTATATATINLNDVDEITVQNLTAAIDENPIDEQVIGTLQATSANTLTYAITYQSTAGAMTIDPSTGELSVADYTLFDFETTPSMFATISVDNGSYSVNATATININDLNESIAIGDFIHGGVVFWIDPTDNTHGLVVAANNQSFGAPWGCQGTTVSPTYSSIGSGAANTVLIESICTTPGTAADLAANLSLNGYDDWFLPSRFELDEYYANKDIVNAAVVANGGAIPNQFHWSSTQSTSNLGAFVVNLTTGSSGSSGKSSNYGVRAVRAF